MGHQGAAAAAAAAAIEAASGALTTYCSGQNLGPERVNPKKVSFFPSSSSSSPSQKQPRRTELPEPRSHSSQLRKLLPVAAAAAAKPQLVRTLLSAIFAPSLQQHRIQ